MVLRQRHTQLPDHHSRNCTEPSSTFPWILTIASLPVALLVLVEYVYPLLVFMALGHSHGEHFSIMHQVKDTWLQLSSPCPVLVNSRTRGKIFHNSTRAGEAHGVTFSDLIETRMILHRAIFEVRKDVNLDSSLKGKYCTFDDWVTTSTHSLIKLEQFFKPEENNCHSGVIHCEESIALSLVNSSQLSWRSNTLEESIALSQLLSTPSDLASLETDNIVLVAKDAGLLPGNSSWVKNEVVFIQISGISQVLCVALSDDGTTTTTRMMINPGDAVKLSHDQCSQLYLVALTDLSLSTIL